MEVKEASVDAKSGYASWYVMPDAGKIPQKRQLTSIEKSLYWLDWGRNSDALYESRERHPFTEEIRDPDEQQVYLRGLDAAIQFYGGGLRREQQGNSLEGNESVHVSSNVRKKRGSPAIVVRYENGVQYVDHTWVKQHDVREGRLR